MLLIALSCIVGNGDGHLKSFGLFYRDPLGSEACLAPACGTVNTTAYIVDDSLALSLSGSRSLLAWRLGILELAKVCDVRKPVPPLQSLIQAARASLRDTAHLADNAPQVFAAIEYSVGLYAQSFS